MLDKHYQPASTEGRIYSMWEQGGAFSANRRERKNADSYCIVIPPPNVTGSLHMGHALNNTLQDILIRFERMRGKDVLWQPGTDHAGIATQMVVERQMQERQEPGRREIGREKFLEKVWAWKEASGGTITGQLKRLGASCDWSRDRFTMDEGLSRAVLKVFVDLYNQGLIYKDKRLVNWDPKLLTAISDLEVESVETKGHLWHFRYPIKNPPKGAPKHIVVATTRPETMLGDTAVAVHPDDKRYKKLVGKTVILPLVGREIPIIADEYSDPEKGTGAVKITPAHDFNDFEVGKRHGLDAINVLDAHAAIVSGAEADAAGIPEQYRGLDRFEARSAVVADFEAAELLEKIEDHTLMVPFGDRSNVVIEPWLTDQWYVNAAELAKPAIRAVEDGETVFVPRNWEKVYYEWMRNIQPWCISRQLWWGHQIPAWYGPDGETFVAESEEEANKLAAAHFGKRSFTLKRDEDVLDTWFSSALWPFSTLGWPDQTPELKRYYKTDVLSTAHDIIFFWVARMMMMGLHFMKDENDRPEVPFHTVYIHPLIRDAKGQKMSKSKGNGLDPLDIIDGIEIDDLLAKRTTGLMNPKDAERIAADTKKEFPQGIKAHGADALRFTLAAMAAQGRDIKLSMSRVEGYRNFGTKLWNAARFAEMNEAIRVADFDPSKVEQTLNRWIAGETAKAKRDVTAAIEAFRFNDAASAVYQFVWGVFCDWYLELAKPILNGADEAAKAETRAMLAWTLDQVLKLLHPFMPFITEELWQRTGEVGPSRDSMLALARWPELEGLGDAAAEAEIGWIIRLVTEVRSTRAEMKVPEGAKLPFEIVGAAPDVVERARNHEDTLLRLGRLDSLRIVERPAKGAVQVLAGDTVGALLLKDFIDIEAEQARLERDAKKAKGEIAGIDKKLANEAFMAKAPEHVVDEQRERRADYEATLNRLEDALRRLKAAA